jgi:hypothetical protein
MLDLFNLTARRVHDMPEGWRWFSLDSYNKPEDFIEVKGAIPCGVITRGPRKGSPKWPKEYDTLWIRRRDMDRVALEWEQETGKCYKCEGTGQEFAGWSTDKGSRTRECSRCTASGKASGPIAP